MKKIIAEMSLFLVTFMFMLSPPNARAQVISDAEWCQYLVSQNQYDVYWMSQNDQLMGIEKAAMQALVQKLMTSPPPPPGTPPPVPVVFMNVMQNFWWLVMDIAQQWFDGLNPDIPPMPDDFGLFVVLDDDQINVIVDGINNYLCNDQTQVIEYYQQDCV